MSRTRVAAISTIALIAVGALSGCSIAAQVADPPHPTTEAPESPAGSELPESDDTDPSEDEWAVSATTTDTELAWIALMSPEGEYAAAASYQAVLDAYGPVEPYATILAAELRHIDALVRQLEKDGVAVPANPYLGEIPAPYSLLVAAEAWADGEVDNVQMYDELIAQASGTALLRVLGNLRSASLDSHLPLFELAADNGGTLTEEQMRSST